MKKTFTLLLVVLISNLAFVNSATASKLILKTNAYKASVFINGEVFKNPSGHFEINHLQPGNHFLKVTEKRGGQHYHNHTDDYRGYNRHHSRNRVLLFKGKIFIPERSIVYARISRRGRLIIDEVIPIRKRRNHQRGDFRNSGDYNRDYRYQNQREYRNRRGYTSSINIALKMITNASFESDRKAIARQFITSNTVYSQDVLDIITRMNFESSRLEIAKFAYRQTADPENYFLVNKGFNYSSSIKSLNRFIR